MSPPPDPLPFLVGLVGSIPRPWRRRFRKEASCVELSPEIQFDVWRQRPIETLEILDSSSRPPFFRNSDITLITRRVPRYTTSSPTLVPAILKAILVLFFSSDLVILPAHDLSILHLVHAVKALSSESWKAENARLRRMSTRPPILVHAFERLDESAKTFDARLRLLCKASGYLIGIKESAFLLPKLPDIGVFGPGEDAVLWEFVMRESVKGGNLDLGSVEELVSSVFTVLSDNPRAEEFITTLSSATDRLSLRSCSTGITRALNLYKDHLPNLITLRDHSSRSQRAISCFWHHARGSNSVQSLRELTQSLNEIFESQKQCEKVSIFGLSCLLSHSHFGSHQTLPLTSYCLCGATSIPTSDSFSISEYVASQRQACCPTPSVSYPGIPTENDEDTTSFHVLYPPALVYKHAIGLLQPGFLSKTNHLLPLEFAGKRGRGFVGIEYTCFLGNHRFMGKESAETFLSSPLPLWTRCPACAASQALLSTTSAPLSSPAPSTSTYSATTPLVGMTTSWDCLAQLSRIWILLPPEIHASIELYIKCNETTAFFPSTPLTSGAIICIRLPVLYTFDAKMLIPPHPSSPLFAHSVLAPNWLKLERDVLKARDVVDDDNVLRVETDTSKRHGGGGGGGGAGAGVNESYKSRPKNLQCKAKKRARRLTTALNGRRGADDDALPGFKIHTKPS